MHVRRMDGRVFQAVEEHRVVGPRAAPDCHPAVRHVGRAPGPVADAGRCEHRARLFPVQAPVGTAPGLKGQGRPGLVRWRALFSCGVPRTCARNKVTPPDQRGPK